VGAKQPRARNRELRIVQMPRRKHGPSRRPVTHVELQHRANDGIIARRAEAPHELAGETPPSQALDFEREDCDFLRRIE